VNIQVNEEDFTVHQILTLLNALKGRRCWFRLYDPVENETSTVVADFGNAYAVPDMEVRILTSEGVVALGEIISIEPYERFDNDGKDRYS